MNISYSKQFANKSAIKWLYDLKVANLLAEYADWWWLRSCNEDPGLLFGSSGGGWGLF